MNPHTMNGERLLQQGRPGEAIDALRQGLAADPNDGHGHAMLALALLQNKDADGAEAAGREAVRQDPGSSFAHYVWGMSLLILKRLDEAEQAGRRALELNPNGDENFQLLALVALERKRFDAALNWVDRGLAVEPESPELLNLRGQLLVKLRRTGEAAQVARDALGADPHNPHSHANAGWTALHNNDPKQALVHFQEALRLDPGYAYAKEGLAEALKAKNPIYRVFLGMLLWMVRLDPRVRLGVIVGGYILYRVGMGAAQTNPGIAPVLWPLLIAYMVFAWMTWVGMPLFDLMLRTSRYGRHALSPRQKMVSTVLGLFILGVVTAFGVYLLTGSSLFQMAAIQIGLFALMLVGVLQMHRAARYRMLLGGCSVLALLLVGGWVLAFTVDPGMGGKMMQFYLYGFIGMMWFIALGGGGGRRAGVM